MSTRFKAKSKTIGTISDWNGLAVNENIGINLKKQAAYRLLYSLIGWESIT